MMALYRLEVRLELRAALGLCARPVAEVTEEAAEAEVPIEGEERPALPALAVTALGSADTPLPAFNSATRARTADPVASGTPSRTSACGQ